jgi:SAM-dependent methyltransferase
VLEGRPGPWLPPGFEVRPQAAGGLDERLEHAFATAFARGPGPVFLVGMDTPQLTPALLSPSWDDADALLGLSTDGGFWGVGLRRPAPEAFTGVPMSRVDTGARQLARLRGLGLRVRLLPELTDVDTPDDARVVAALAPGTRFAAEHARLAARPVTRRSREEHPLELYAAALDGLAVQVQTTSRTWPLDSERWAGPVDAADRMLLNRCEGTVLDLGCGPGRLVEELAAAGHPALGVDISPSAVDRTAARGASVLLRDVRDRLPAEGRWDTVLLADGNIGIGGDPDGLLRRCAHLLRPAGLLLVEADPDDVAEVIEEIRLVAGPRRARPMPWARLGSRALAPAARRAGFRVVEEWRTGGRVFLAFRSRGA